MSPGNELLSSPEDALKRKLSLLRGGLVVTIICLTKRHGVLSEGVSPGLFPSQSVTAIPYHQGCPEVGFLSSGYQKRMDLRILASTL